MKKIETIWRHPQIQQILHRRRRFQTTLSSLHHPQPQ